MVYFTGRRGIQKILQPSNPTMRKVLGEGSLFSPMLFGKFFDPSDAFPLWDFESDILLSHLRSSVDWSQTEQAYILKAKIPGNGKNSIQVHVDNGKIVEISGQWKQQQRESRTNDWRCGHWWEYGFVRRLEIPEDADWKNIEVLLHNETSLEIKIPNHLCYNPAQGNAAAL